MGMYDYFECTVSCPVCGNKLEGFQTKDFERLLDVYQPGDIVNDRSLKAIQVYTTCTHYREFEKIEDDLLFVTLHGVWIEYKIPIKHGCIVQDQNQWDRKVEHLDWNGVQFLKGESYTEQSIKDQLNTWNKNRAEDCRITGIEVANHE